MNWFWNKKDQPHKQPNNPPHNPPQQTVNQNSTREIKDIYSTSIEIVDKLRVLHREIDAQKYFMHLNSCKNFRLRAQKIFPKIEFFSTLEIENNDEAELTNNLPNKIKDFQQFRINFDKPDYLALYWMYEAHFICPDDYGIERDIIREKLFFILSFALAPFWLLLEKHNPINEIRLMKEFNEWRLLENEFVKKTQIFLSKVKEANLFPNIPQWVFVLAKYLLETICFNRSNFKELDDLAKDQNAHPELLYKCACINVVGKKPRMAKKYFKRCYDKKYYRAYADYGEWLFSLKDIKDSDGNLEYPNALQEALTVLKEGYEQGNYLCYIYYYGLLIQTYDYEKMDYNKLKPILEVLLDLYAIGEITYAFDFIWFVKLAKKKGFPVESEYKKYILEMKTFFCQIVEEGRNAENPRFKDSNTLIMDCHLSLGLIYYYNLAGDVEDQSHIERAYNIFKKLIDILKEEQDKSKLRFSFLFFYKSAKKLNRFTNEMAKEYSTLHSEILARPPKEKMSSSFYYQIAKIHERGFGNINKNTFSAYVYYKLASEFSINQLNSIGMIHYCKCKAAKRMKRLENDYRQQLKQLMSRPINDQCDICRQQKRLVINLPCQHTACRECNSEWLKQQKRCHMCRGKVVGIINEQQQEENIEN